jgi:hypothetical protein
LGIPYLRNVDKTWRKKGLIMAPLRPGDPAPEFELARDGGGSISLSALRGKPVVLFFYPKDDTKTCTVEAISFSGLSEAFASAGVALIGISPDSVKSHDRFAKKHEEEPGRNLPGTGAGELSRAAEGAFQRRRAGRGRFDTVLLPINDGLHQHLTGRTTRFVNPNKV